MKASSGIASICHLGAKCVDTAVGLFVMGMLAFTVVDLAYVGISYVYSTVVNYHHHSSLDSDDLLDGSDQNRRVYHIVPGRSNRELESGYSRRR